MAKVSRFKGTKLAKGFQTDPNAEQHGVWRVHPDFGIHVRVRRSTLPDHRAALRRHFKPFAHLTTVPVKDELLVKMKAAAEVLVADWGQSQTDEKGQPVLGGDDMPIREPLVDAEGHAIAATQDAVLEAFIDMPDFFRWVSEEADSFENYRVTVLEGNAGNSSGSSDGSGNGEPSTQSPSSIVAPLGASLAVSATPALN